MSMYVCKANVSAIPFPADMAKHYMGVLTSRLPLTTQLFHLCLIHSRLFCFWYLILGFKSASNCSNQLGISICLCYTHTRSQRIDTPIVCNERAPTKVLTEFNISLVFTPPPPLRLLLPAASSSTFGRRNINSFCFVFGFGVKRFVENCFDYFLEVLC